MFSKNDCLIKYRIIKFEKIMKIKSNRSVTVY